MLKSKFTKRAGLLLAGGLALSGCEYHPEESVTDVFAQNLLAQTEDDQSLVGQYHTMVDNDGNHIGVILVKDVMHNADISSDCILYKAWAYDMNDNMSSQSNDRKTCVSSNLTLGQ